MPILSRFTRLGLLKLSRRPSHAETIYRSLIAALGSQFADNGHEEAKAYARSMGLGLARVHIERAAGQVDPERVADMLPIREDEWGIVPGASDSMATRRAVWGARKRIPAGATFIHVENALRTILGDDLVAYHPTPTADAVNSPATAGDSPVNFQRDEVPRKLVQLTTSQTMIGSAAVGYEAVDPTDATLLVGDVVVVDGATPGLGERVTVTAVGANTFTATWTKAHAIGALCTTAPFPAWAGSKRHSLIAVSETAAADKEQRRKVDEQMRRHARAVSTWDICAATTGATTGPFDVEVGLIGITTIGAVIL